MTESVTLPREVYESLKAGCTDGTADDLLSMLTRNGRNTVAHPGDGYGRVLAWMWGHDRDEAVLAIAGLLADLRVHRPGASEIDPPVSVDELLRGLRFCLPPGFDAYDELVTYTREHITGYYATAFS